MIAVIDYGMGNLRSVEKALHVVGAKTKVTSCPKDLAKAEKVVFPGVGSFGAAMKELKRRRLIEPIKDAIAEGKYFLGLCLGMQLLFEKSDESPGVKGLCVLRGDVRRFKFTKDERRKTKDELKVPHMGWNSIRRSSFVDRRSSLSGRLRFAPLSFVDRRSSILNGVPDNAYMYFAHSYYANPKDKGVILTTTDYGIKFASGVAKDNVFGLQFHPEKSQAVGLRMLKNFVGL